MSPTPAGDQKKTTQGLGDGSQSPPETLTGTPTPAAPHSPLPWRADIDDPIFDADVIRDAKGRYVAQTGSRICRGKKIEPHNPNDAALIVHRVNVHEELVAALKAIYATVRGDEKSECWTIGKYLDKRDIFHADIGSPERLIAEVCRHALTTASRGTP